MVVSNWYTVLHYFAACQQTRWCKIPACKNWCKSQGYVRGVTCATGPGGYGSCCCLPWLLVRLKIRDNKMVLIKSLDCIYSIFVHVAHYARIAQRWHHIRRRWFEPRHQKTFGDPSELSASPMYITAEESQNTSPISGVIGDASPKRILTIGDAYWKSTASIIA